MDCISGMIGSSLEGYFTAMLKQTEGQAETSTGSGGAASSFDAVIASSIVDAVSASSETTDASSSETDESSEKSTSSSDASAGMDIYSYAGYLNDLTGKLMSQNDLDGDARLSDTEATKLGMTTADFTAIDSDSDGKLSASELNEIRAKMDIPLMTSDLISGNDTSDESLTSTSDAGMSDTDFNAVDTNVDGKLSSDELNTVAYSMLTKILDAFQATASTETKSAGLDMVT